MKSTISRRIPFSHSSTIFRIDELDSFIEKVTKDVPKVKSNKRIEYYNVPCAFDIETSSFYERGEKRAIMYEWTLGINGEVLIGRTWEQFLDTYYTLVMALDLNRERRLLVYIHNEAFEFQFIRKRLTWSHVFAIDDRKPLYALTEEGVEFRCSYLLSGYGLAKLGEGLKRYPVRKLEGDLDYSLLRHSETPMTDRELAYCENDVRVVMSYIQEEIETLGDITRIPLTKTGYVRKYCRDACLYEGGHKKNTKKYLRYHRMISSMALTVDEYTQLKRAFQGGFTHANAFYADRTLENVRSFDFTSSYPAVMVSERFPMSKAEEIRISSTAEFERNLRLYCCLFDVEIYGLEASTLYEHPLSASRCRALKGCDEDNGRVVRAKHLITTVTEQDWYILKRFYTWDVIRVGNFKRYRRGYLPTELVRSILELYEKKTTLKDVEGKEEEYQKAKEMLNSVYGMCVTDICRDENVYEDETWSSVAADVEAMIRKYNNSKNRFLSYAWGVWVTAYARRNLFSGIYEFKEDYVYSDTDSVKGLNAEDHRAYIEAYNVMISDKLRRACKHHRLPFKMTRPTNVKDKEKPLGVWEDEGLYTRYKTLGAKRYMTEKDGKISITVSGVNKKVAVPYLIGKYGKKIFDKFTDDLYIPPEFTGKMTHTYIDGAVRGYVVDYLGNEAEYEELSSVHLENADYSLSMSEAYVDYIMGVRELSK